MSTHQQQQQGDQKKKRTWFSRRNVVIATIVIVASLITTAWILSILCVISATYRFCTQKHLGNPKPPPLHRNYRALPIHHPLLILLLPSGASPGFHHPRIPGLSNRERKRSRKFMRNSPRTTRPLLCLPASAARENPRLPPLSLSTRKNSASMAKDHSWLKRSGCASMQLSKSA